MTRFQKIIAQIVTIVQRFPGLVVLGLYGLLAVWIWLPPSTPDLPPARPPALDIADGLTATESRLAELAEVTAERPLFQPTRRPLPTESAPVSVAAPEATITLVGILGDSGSESALVRLSSSPELYLVQPGDQLAEWQILGVGPASIELSKSGSTPFILPLGQ